MGKVMEVSSLFVSLADISSAREFRDALALGGNMVPPIQFMTAHTPADKLENNLAREFVSDYIQQAMKRTRCESSIRTRYFSRRRVICGQ